MRAFGCIWIVLRLTVCAPVGLECRYVLCPGCKSVDTLLDKDSATRLMHLRCQQVGARVAYGGGGGLACAGQPASAIS